MPRHVRTAQVALTASLTALAEQGRTVPCRTDPDAWVSEDPSVRASAAAACVFCPALRVCRAYSIAAREEFGVWGGRDRSRAELPRITSGSESPPDVRQPCLSPRKSSEKLGDSMTEPTEPKQCPLCGDWKPVADFPPRKDRESGVMSRCHRCDAARAGAYRGDHLEQERERQRLYQRRRHAARRSASATSPPSGATNQPETEEAS